MLSDKKNSAGISTESVGARQAAVCLAYRMAGSDDDGAVGSGGDVRPPRDQSGRVVAGTEFNRGFRHFVSPRGAGVARGFSSDDRPVGDALGVTGATFAISGTGKGVAAGRVQPG